MKSGEAAFGEASPRMGDAAEAWPGGMASKSPQNVVSDFDFQSHQRCDEFPSRSGDDTRLRKIHAVVTQSCARFPIDAPVCETRDCRTLTVRAVQQAAH